MPFLPISVWLQNNVIMFSFFHSVFLLSRYRTTRHKRPRQSKSTSESHHRQPERPRDLQHVCAESGQLPLTHPPATAWTARAQSEGPPETVLAQSRGRCSGPGTGGKNVPAQLTLLKSRGGKIRLVFSEVLNIYTYIIIYTYIYTDWL